MHTWTDKMNGVWCDENPFSSLNSRLFYFTKIILFTGSLHVGAISET
jgi:hypothetical protein